VDAALEEVSAGAADESLEDEALEDDGAALLADVDAAPEGGLDEAAADVCVGLGEVTADGLFVAGRSDVVTVRLVAVDAGVRAAASVLLPNALTIFVNRYRTMTRATRAASRRRQYVAGARGPTGCIMAAPTLRGRATEFRPTRGRPAAAGQMS
jgi:hypothetical protein